MGSNGRFTAQRRMDAPPRRRHPAAILLLVGAVAISGLAGCGGAFMTSTPSYARYSSEMVFKEFKAKGLRVEGVRDIARDMLGADVPPYSEAKGFFCGASDGSTATLFTFDSPDRLAAMADFIRKKYATKQRQITGHNVLLAFWLPGKDDTSGYDSALMGLP